MVLALLRKCITACFQEITEDRQIPRNDNINIKLNKWSTGWSRVDYSQVDYWQCLCTVTPLPAERLSEKISECDMVWCYSGLKIDECNLKSYNSRPDFLSYIHQFSNQSSIKPCLIVHLVAVWTLTYLRMYSLITNVPNLPRVVCTREQK